MAVWLLVLAIWVQFTSASIQELEPQAATLGGILVAILLVGGLTVWAAILQQRDRDR